MSSRREEKEARRAERLAAEEAFARSEGRRKRIGLAVGTLLALAAVAAVVIALTAGGGDEPDEPRKSNLLPIPAQQERDLAQAARAAECRLQSFPEAQAGNSAGQHTSSEVKYETNPPTYGPHADMPASDGDYVGQGTPSKETLVHALEHGRIIIQYRPGLERRRIAQLQTLLAEKPKEGVIEGYNALLMENNTQMPFPVAATAWGQLIGCPTFTDKTFDALRAFRTQYVDKAPELVPVPQ